MSVTWENLDKQDSYKKLLSLKGQVSLKKELNRQYHKYKVISDNNGFMIYAKDKEHLELVTYLCKHANSKDYTTSRFYKQLSDDLYQKGFIKDKEHSVIFNPPKIINKSEINKILNSINQEMEEAAEEFYKTNKKDNYSL